MLARYQFPRGASMAWANVARRALSPSTPRAQGAPLRASGVDRSARPSKWLSCQQCEDAPLGLPRSIFNRHPPEVSITEICYQFRVSHMGCSPVPLSNSLWMGACIDGAPRAVSVDWAVAKLEFPAEVTPYEIYERTEILDELERVLAVVGYDIEA